MGELLFRCPSCGWTGLRSAPYQDWPVDEFIIDTVPPYETKYGAASGETCLCCGFHFGAQPDSIAAARSFEVHRSAWYLGGCHWHDPSARPEDWDCDLQLGRARIDDPSLSPTQDPLMSGQDFFDLLYERIPVAREELDGHLESYGELLLHLVVADVFRLAAEAFESGDENLPLTCLEIVDHAWSRGNGSVINAVAVSFVGAVTWRTEHAEFFEIWPEGLKREAQRQRAWRPKR